ncbi:hypothetical protein C8J56DRAFT_1116968 [Mycena floridula]|nr:hypothetical protein C8J56DRAFT_1116968 [Mycena floridula]
MGTRGRRRERRLCGVWSWITSRRYGVLSHMTPVMDFGGERADYETTEILATAIKVPKGDSHLTDFLTNAAIAVDLIHSLFRSVCTYHTWKTRNNTVFVKFFVPGGTAHRPVDGHAMQGLLVNRNDEDDSETVMEAINKCGATAFFNHLRSGSLRMQEMEVDQPYLNKYRLDGRPSHGCFSTSENRCTRTVTHIIEKFEKFSTGRGMSSIQRSRPTVYRCPSSNASANRNPSGTMWRNSRGIGYEKMSRTKTYPEMTGNIEQAKDLLYGIALVHSVNRRFCQVSIQALSVMSGPFLHLPRQIMLNDIRNQKRVGFRDKNVSKPLFEVDRRRVLLKLLKEETGKVNEVRSLSRPGIYLCEDYGSN